MVDYVSNEEFKLLDDAKRLQNPWFRAMIAAAALMVDRRVEYSGDQTKDPYTNFNTVAAIKGTLRDAIIEAGEWDQDEVRILDTTAFPGDPAASAIFDQVVHKMARLIVAIAYGRIKDAANTLLDFSNYLLLTSGRMLDELQRQSDD